MTHLPVALRGRMTQTVSGGRTMKFNLILKFIRMVIWSSSLSQMTFVAQISQFDQPVPTTKKIICINLIDRNLRVTVFSMCDISKINSPGTCRVWLCCYTWQVKDVQSPTKICFLLFQE